MAIAPSGPSVRGDTASFRGDTASFTTPTAGDTTPTAGFITWSAIGFITWSPTNLNVCLTKLVNFLKKAPKRFPPLFTACSSYPPRPFPLFFEEVSSSF